MRNRRQYREPRPGEILATITRLGHYSCRPEEGRNGPEIRIQPSPCCNRAERSDGGACVINAKTGLWHCFRCQKTGGWASLCRLMGSPLADPFVEAERVDFSVYEKIRAKMRRPVTGGHHPALLAYALGRGLTARTLNAWRVSTAGPEILRWPLFALDATGRWTAANARLRVCLNRDKARVADWFEVKGGPTELCMGNHLLGQDPVSGARIWAPGASDPSAGTSASPEGSIAPEGLKTPPRRVLICEGQWDAMTAYQLGIPNALSLPNGAAHVNVAGMLRYVPDDFEVWLAVDMDEAGDRCAEAFFAQLGGERVARLHLPHKDLNAWLQAEPDLTAAKVLATARGMTPQLVRREQAIMKATGEPPRTFRTLGDLMREAVEPDAELTDQPLCETPWSELTRAIGGGWRRGQTTGLLAPSGVGKTTVVNQIAVHANRTIAVGLLSLESARGLVTADLIAKARGWECEFPEQERLDRLMLSPLEGVDVTWQRCLEEMEALAVAGAKMLIWDNPDYIMPRTAANPNAIKATAYARFQSLCKKYEAHGIIVWQPAKVDRDQVVNSGHQKGLSQALQDADNYLNLNKFGLLRRLEVEKTRSDEDAARHVWLKYNRTTKCMHVVPNAGGLMPAEGGPGLV